MTRPKCPSCGRTLYVWRNRPRKCHVFCSSRYCPSDVSYDGATAPTVEEAVKRLNEKVEEEKMEREKAK